MSPFSCFGLLIIQVDNERHILFMCEKKLTAQPHPTHLLIMGHERKKCQSVKGQFVVVKQDQITMKLQLFNALIYKNSMTLKLCNFMLWVELNHLVDYRLRMKRIIQKK